MAATINLLRIEVSPSMPAGRPAMRWARPGPYLKVYAPRSGSMSYKLLMNEESTDPRIFISQLRARDRLLATALQMYAAPRSLAKTNYKMIMNADQEL